MITSPPKTCAHAACPVLVYDGGSYCTNHASDKTASRRRYEVTRADSESVRLRRGTNWRRLSEMVRAQQPLCVDPFGTHAGDGLPVYSAQVHHILGAEEHPELIFEMTNLAAICTKCHAKIEAAERRGESTTHLFAGKAATQPTQWFA